MIDSRIQQIDAIRPLGERPEECLIGTQPRGSRLPGEYPSLMLLLNLFFKTVFGI